MKAIEELKQKINELRSQYSKLEPVHRKQVHTAYEKQFKRYLSENGFKDTPVDGEAEYVNKWKQLYDLVEPYSYRLFSKFIGKTPYIVPEDIGHNIIEEILNPIRYRAYYADKNVFTQVVGKEYFPESVAGRILGGVILDKDLRPISEEDFNSIINNYESLIIKPSIGSCSGMGFMKFKRIGSELRSGEHTLNWAFLKQYGDNFIIQKTLKQSSFMAQFCPTAVNTMKLGLYRSVKDEKSHVICGVLRMGSTGELVDNSLAGGRFVGIDVKTGKLGARVFKATGHPVTRWNDVDFENNTFVVPNWDKIIDMAKKVSQKIHHHRLLGLDVTLDENNNPLLIEYNLNSYSYFYFLFTGQKPLGEYTDEIIDYCKERI